MRMYDRLIGQKMDGSEWVTKSVVHACRVRAIETMGGFKSQAVGVRSFRCRCVLWHSNVLWRVASLVCVCSRVGVSRWPASCACVCSRVRLVRLCR